jgi:hypothetical protein
LEGILEEDPENDETDAVYIPPPVDILTDEEDLNDDLTMEEQIVSEIAGIFEIHTHSHLMIEKKPNRNYNKHDFNFILSQLRHFTGK